MPNDVEQLEITLRIHSVEQVRSFYGPILAYLGYKNTDDKAGLSTWVSNTRQTTIVLIETAGAAFGLRGTHPLQITNRLTFTAESARQVQEFHTLLQIIDADVLIDPLRYATHTEEQGVVFRYRGGPILELRWHDGPRPERTGRVLPHAEAGAPALLSRT